MTMAPLTLTTSTIMTISASHWLIMWVMMEMNTYAFLTMLSKEKKTSNMKMLTYFSFQSIPSTVFLAAILMTSTTQTTQMNHMIIMSMATKMACPPLHSWAIKMIPNMNYLNSTIMMTWQKTIPLYILTLINASGVTYTLSCTALITSTLMAMKFNNSMTLMMVSSITHTAWMMMLSMWNSLATMMYLTAYTHIITVTMMLMPQKSTKMMMPTPHKLSMTVSMASMGGIPPTLGFTVKMMAIYYLMSAQMPTLILSIMMVSTLVMAYMYMSMLIMMMSSPTQSKNMKMSKLPTLSLLTNLGIPMLMVS